MINGYEYLYNSGNGVKPKYGLHIASDVGHFMHNIDGAGVRNHLGVTCCEAYTNIIEQNVGKSFYKTMFKILSDYETLYRTALDLHHKDLRKDQLEAALKNKQKQFNDKIKYRNTILDKIKKLVTSKTENASFELEQMNNELKVVEDEIGVLKPDVEKLKQDFAKAKEVLEKDYVLIGKLTKSLTKDMEMLNDEKMDKLKKKFADKDFQMQIEQDFVDTMLLPSEQAKEGNTRLLAQAWFKLFKNEFKYLSSLKPVITELINNINEQYSEKTVEFLKLNAKVSGQYQLVQGMKNLSTDIAENCMGRFDEKRFSLFYLEVSKMLKDSDYGKNPEHQMLILPEIAHNKYKYRLDVSKKSVRDLDTGREIFDGVSKIIDAQVIISSEEIQAKK